MQPKFETVATNDIHLRVALAGKGPLVLLVHGWPESWYSWRHQIPILAEAGYRVASPDVRGYGMADLRLVKLIERAGHWVQQERPAEVNAALATFLRTL